MYAYLIGWESNILVTLHGVGETLVILLTIIHMIRTLGIRNSAFFATISISIGFFAEYIGVMYGIPFGKYYYTETMFFPKIGPIPIIIPIMWMVLTYLAYSITNFIFSKEISTHSISARSLILFSTLDGLCTTSFDLIADPVAVTSGMWVWIDQGPYYGIPFTNFLGWFLVTFTITLIYRITHREHIKVRIDWHYYTPSVIFFILILSIEVGALYAGHPELILIGTVATLPYVMIPLVKTLTNLKGD